MSESENDFSYFCVVKNTPCEQSTLQSDLTYLFLACGLIVEKILHKRSA